MIVASTPWESAPVHLRCCDQVHDVLSPQSSPAIYKRGRAAMPSLGPKVGVRIAQNWLIAIELRPHCVLFEMGGTAESETKYSP